MELELVASTDRLSGGALGTVKKIVQIKINQEI